MLLPVIISPRTWLLFTVVLSLIVISETIGSNRFNINFGFDLYQGNNGILRIRDFEAKRGINRRAAESSNESSSSPKGKDSSENSQSEERPKKREHEPKEIKKNSDDSNDSDSNSENDSRTNLHSTRGLRAEEFDPENYPKPHSKYKHSADESEGSARRR